MSEPVINLNELDKSNWKTYRFDEIASSISERIDPTTTDLDVYIGLEHLDSGSIHIKRQGKRDDVSGQKLRFYQGDVIFGRRRAYQRKAGIATTDGFCSAHSLVLRANPDVIDPLLFPFFLHSDLFMNRAVDISVGSLSPTINWGTLKKQVFIVPPIDIQAQLLELFSSADLAFERKKKVEDLLCFNEKVFVTRELKCISKSNTVISLGDLAHIKTGKLDSNAAVENGQFPFFTCSPNTLRIDNYSFDCEALLLAGNNAAGVYPLKHYKGKFNAYQRTYVITIKDERKVTYPYLIEVIKSQLELLQRLSVGSSTKFLTINVLKKIEVPEPSETEQASFVDNVDAFKTAINSVKKCISDEKCLIERQINRVF